MTGHSDTSAADHVAETGGMGDLAAALARLQQSHAGCDLLAYGDLAAQLVLRAEPAGARPQEALDALCAEAREGFALADRLAGGGETVSEPVISLVSGETRMFLRGGDGEEVLLMAGPDLASVQAVLPEARALLAPVSASASAAEQGPVE